MLRQYLAYFLVSPLRGVRGACLRLFELPSLSLKEVFHFRSVDELCPFMGQQDIPEGHLLCKPKTL